jgi:mono/diheme cytochrome c family protein
LSSLDEKQFFSILLEDVRRTDDTIPRGKRAMKSLRLIGLLLLVSAGPVVAQEQGGPPSAARGQALARRWCAACHLTQLRLTPTDPPTFYAIAKDPQKTPEYIRNFLVSPHKDMPPIQLTPGQIDDLIAYFEDLKVR